MRERQREITRKREGGREGEKERGGGERERGRAGAGKGGKVKRWKR